MLKKFDWLVLFFLSVLCLVVDLSGISNKPAWYDEKIMIIAANGMGEEITNNQIVTKQYFRTNNSLLEKIQMNNPSNGGNNLFHVIALRLQFGLFGSTIFTGRFLSVIFHLFLILVAYLFSIKFINRKLAIIFSLLILFNSLFITQANQIRAYTMAAFFCLTSTAFLFYKYNWVNLLFYFTLVLLAFFSHYLTLFVLIIHPLIIFYQFGKKHLRFSYILAWFTAFGILVIYVFTLGRSGFETMKFMNHVHYVSAHLHNFDYIKQQEIIKSMPFISPAKEASILNIGKGIYQQISQLTGAGYLFGNGSNIFLIFITILTGLYFYIRGIKFSFLIFNFQQVIFLALLSVSSTMFAIAEAIVNGHTISFDGKYVVFSLPFFLLFISLGINETLGSKTFKLLNKILLGSFILLYCSGLFNEIYRGNELKMTDPYQELVTIIRTKNSGQDTIVIGNTFDIQLLASICPVSCKFKYVKNLQDSVFLRSKSKNEFIYTLKNKRI